MSAFLAVAAPARAELGRAPLGGLGFRATEVVAPALTPEDVGRTVDVLLEGARPLAALPVREVVASLAAVGRRFLAPDDPLREGALALLPDTSGLSPAMTEVVLDGMARDWTEGPLERLLETDVGDPDALDRFVLSGGRAVRAFGPTLCTQIVAGSVPGVGVSALIRSLLAKSPTLLKPGHGDVVLPVLFARGLAEVAPRVADALAVLYWPGSDQALLESALERAEVVTVYGADETVAAVRSSAPATARVVGYHHRVSVGVVGRGALASGASADAVAAEVARAVAIFDQRGCVSPQVVFVEEGAAVAPRSFGERLAAQLEELESSLPGGPLEAGEAATLQQLRGTAELMADLGVAVWSGGADAAWMVVLEPESARVPGRAGRLVRLRPIEDAALLPELLEPLSQHLQTLAVTGLGARMDEVAEACGATGVTRIVPFDEAAFPPAWWRHDGRGPLAELLRWVERVGG